MTCDREGGCELHATQPYTKHILMSMLSRNHDYAFSVPLLATSLNCSEQVSKPVPRPFNM